MRMEIDERCLLIRNYRERPLGQRHWTHLVHPIFGKDNYERQTTCSLDFDRSLAQLVIRCQRASCYPDTDAGHTRSRWHPFHTRVQRMSCLRSRREKR